jgi:DNA-binding CsgD family transcriptional regulator
MHCVNAQPFRTEESFPDLTDRELEILDLMIRHHANPEIAQQLGIADKAIRNHISSIFQ